MTTSNDNGDPANPEDGPLPAEQHAYSLAHDSVTELVGELEMSPQQVGTGILVAALTSFRRELTDEEIAKVLFEYANDYATRNSDKDG